MKKMVSRSISIILSIALIISVFPLNTVFAAQDIQQDSIMLEGDLPETTKDPESSEPSEKGTDELKKANTYIDIPSYVSKDNEKYYQHAKKLDEFDSEYTIAYENTDGTTTFYVFTEPIRYKDEEGKLVDFDRSIVPVTDQKIKDKGYAYKNKSSFLDVYLPDSLANDIGPKIECEGKYSIEILPNVEVSDKEKSDKKYESKLKTTQDLQKSGLKEAAYALEYDVDASDDIQYKYTPIDNGIKEEIIINSYTGQNTFEFTMKLKGIVPELRDDGYIIFKDEKTGEEKGIIPTLFAQDSYTGEYSEDEGHFTENITTEMIEGKSKNEYILKYTVDKAFLEDPNTVYPVIVDPTITYNNSGGTVLSDTFLSSKYPNNYYGGDDHIKLGYSSSALYKCRGITNVFIPESFYALNPTGITDVYYHAYEDSGYTSTAYLGICYVKKDFTYKTTWNTAFSGGETAFYENIAYGDGDGTSPGYKNVTEGGWNNLHFTSIFRAWIKYHYDPNAPGALPYHGILIREQNESNRYRRFRSANYGSTYTYRPTVVINYTNTDTMAPDSVPNPNYTNRTGSLNTGLGQFTASWGIPQDNPKGFVNTGISKYIINVYKSNGTLVKSNVTVNPPTTSTIITGLEDNTNYYYKIYAKDGAGNPTTVPAVQSQCSTFSIDDYSKPEIRGGNVSPGGYTKQNPTLSWTAYDEANNVTSTQYSINGVWYPTSSISGTYVIPSSVIDPLPDGAYQIYMKCTDSRGNTSNNTPEGTLVGTYYKDNTNPDVEITSLFDNAVINSSVQVHIKVDDDHILSWTLDCVGDEINNIANGNTSVDQEYTWNTAGMKDNKTYTLKLYAKDTAGNEIEQTYKILYDKNSVYVSPELVLTNPASGDNEINDEPVNVGYSALTELPETTDTLYVNNEAEPDMVFNPAAYDVDTDSWVYPEGSEAFLYVRATDENNNDYYSTYTYDGNKLTDYFETDTCVKSDNIIYNNSENGSVYTVDTSQGLTGDITSQAIEIDGLLSTVTLGVAETYPDGYPSDDTYKIKYKLIHGTGENDWISISPGTRTVIDKQVGDVYLKAEFTVPEGVESPALDMWYLHARFIPYSDYALINNDFTKNSRGFKDLEGVVLDEENNWIELEPGSVSGTIYSTIRNTACDIVQVDLIADTDIPDGTSMTFQILKYDELGQPVRDQFGQLVWENITARDIGAAVNWQIITRSNQIRLRASFTGTETASPKLKSWKLRVLQAAAGEAKTVKLVQSPENLSALSEANYMIQLRWERSATDTQDGSVTYNVYRSLNPYFEIGDAGVTKVKDNLTDNYYSDYNTNYGQKFYYKVTASKNFNGHPRESEVSNEAWIIVPDQGEIEKKLGLQNYWGYTGFSTGNGTGYINVANGNVVYNSTDMVVSGPFFGIVMRRTYNSYSTTKTAMGYGWDYSFNTRLMKEVGTDGSEALVLKDGDGTFHRFNYNETQGTYESASGTLMKLEVTPTQYQIIRKDGITYHFDINNLKLQSFTDNNGNALSFYYDARGNITQVKNEVDDIVTLNYNKNGRLPGDGDYTYVNDQIDMLDSVEWAQKNGGEDAVTRRADYDYDDDTDKLEKATVTANDPEKTPSAQTYDEEYSYLGGTFIIKNPRNKDTKIVFDNSGPSETIGKRVDYVEDALGNRSDFGYLANKTTMTRMIKEEGTLYTGATVSYEYDSNGLITKKTDGNGFSINYTYYPGNKYLRHTMSYYNDVWDGTADVYTSITYTYTYNSNDNIETVSGTNGSYTQYLYLDLDYIEKPSDVNVKQDADTTTNTHYDYDCHGNVLSIRDPREKTTTQVFGNIDGEAGEGGYLLSTTEWSGKTTKYFYDSDGDNSEWDELGLVIKVEEWDGTTLERTTAEYTYDGFGYTNTVTDALGKVTDIDFDNFGLQKSVTNNAGKTTSYTYDDNANLRTTTDPRGFTTIYDYDDIDRLVTTTAADGVESSIDYGSYNLGGIRADRIEMGTESAAYDSGYYSDPSDANRTDPAAITSVKEYDLAGRLQTSVSGGKTVTYQYDNIGNMKQITDNSGSTAIARYNALNQKVYTCLDPYDLNIKATYSYDLMGNLLEQKDADNNTITYEYDVINRLKTKTQGESITEYWYDDITVSPGYIVNKVEDPEDRVSLTYLNALGQTVKEENLGNASGTPLTTRYVYNDDGSLDKKYVNDGTGEVMVSENAYDEVSGVLEFVYFNEAHDEYNQYTYDDNGNMLTSKSEYKDPYTGVIETINESWAYDEVGRVMSYTQDGNAIAYNYLKNGAIAAIKYSGTVDGSTADTAQRYVYDSCGRLYRIYFDENLASSDTSLGSLAQQYNYNAATGQLDNSVTYMSNLGGTGYMQKAYTYEDAGMVESITYMENGTSQKEQYTYDYNDLGQITAETLYSHYMIDVNGVMKNTLTEITKDFTYYPMGSLHTESEHKVETVNGDTDTDDKTTTYTYDKANNRKTTNDGTDGFAYNYDRFGRLETIKKGDHDDSLSAYKDYQSFTYDVQSRTQSETTYWYSGSTRKIYNKKNYNYYASGQLGNLETLNYNYDQEIESDANDYYYYDGNGQRVRKVTTGGVTKYYYSGSSVLVTLDENNAKTSENIVSASGEIIAGERFQGMYTDKWYFYNYDLRGSVTSVLNPDGAYTSGYQYDAFGNTARKGDSDFKNEMEFIGSISDTSSGLCYMNARYYNPKTGRFLTQDAAGGDAWTNNLYVYCGNNPVSFSDPTGYGWEHDGLVAWWVPDKDDPKEETAKHAADDLVTATSAGIKIKNETDLAESYKNAFGSLYEYSQYMAKEVYKRFGNQFDSRVSEKALKYEIYGHVKLYDMLKDIEPGDILKDSIRKSTEEVDTLFKIDGKDGDDTLMFCVLAKDLGSLYSFDDKKVADMVAAGFVTARAYQLGLLF